MTRKKKNNNNNNNAQKKEKFCQPLSEEEKEELKKWNKVVSEHDVEPEDIVDLYLEAFEKHLLEDDHITYLDQFVEKRQLSKKAIEHMFYNDYLSDWELRRIARQRQYFDDEDFYSYGQTYYNTNDRYIYEYDEKIFKDTVIHYLEDILGKNDTQEGDGIDYRIAARTSSKKEYKIKASHRIADNLADNGYWLECFDELIIEQLPVKRWLSFIGENPHYKNMAAPYIQAYQAVEDYERFYYTRPATKRHFIIDVGPTNSGKTHAGIEQMAHAESGVYLGPLRLLAMEVADTLNEEYHVLCSMVTGEEAHVIDEATHVASTVEMLDRHYHYEVAIIDECQMITDPSRGYAWMSAITSVDADTIHLCMAPEALELIKSILDGMNEEYEIVEHERLTPLEMQAKNTAYPKGIRKGDALIVFSRKSVQEYTTDLARHGIKASMVYGALPYAVRREEVRKFIDGETDVVVATDAIGMGMNLPVKRVVFMETEKYNGETTHDLTPSEVKQIAGRAGRYGKYETGYVSVASRVNGNARRDVIENGLAAEIVPAEIIRVDIPHALVDMDTPLSALMHAWSQSEIDEPYVKRSLKEEIKLARRVQDLPNDFVLDAVSIPFKSGDRFVPLDDIWEGAVRRAYKGQEHKVNLYEVGKNTTLLKLEDAAKVADLAYGLAKHYGTAADLERIEENRQKIVQLMIKALKKDPRNRR